MNLQREPEVAATPEVTATPTVPTHTGISALAHTWARLHQNSLRHLMVVAGLCLGIALLLTALDGRGFGTKLVYSLCIGAFCTAIVDATRLLVATLWDRLRRGRGLPEGEEFNGWRGAIPGAVLAMVLGPPLGMSVGDWLTGNRSVSLLQWGSTSTRVTLVLGVLGTVVSMVVISSMERLHTARVQAEAAQRLAAQTQLRLLQSQLEPHMLFNTLANLRVLIGLEPARAQQMLDHLINFLRATLNASRSQSHPLATEFDRAADYLALMAVRMGPRLAVQLELPDVLRALPVPPLLLQPLVENAIKHGLEPQVAGGRIEVRAMQQGQRLLLQVRDTGAGLGAAAVAGTVGSQFGLDQIRQRLKTLYGVHASLQLQPATDGRGGTLAQIDLPLTTCP